MTGKFDSEGVKRIAAERLRQVEKEGWTAAHDDAHTECEMAIAAACYAAPYSIKADVCRLVPCGCREAICEHWGGSVEKRGWQDPWPWNEEWDKRGEHDRVKSLTIAGALIAAEIDRLIRSASAPTPPQTTLEKIGTCKNADHNDFGIHAQAGYFLPSLSQKRGRLGRSITAGPTTLSTRSSDYSFMRIPEPLSTTARSRR